MTNRMRRWVSIRQTLGFLWNSLSGNRVVAARMIGVAAQNATRSEPRSSQRAVSRDRFAREVRATRIEPTVVPEQRPKRVLVTAQKREQQRLHWFYGFTSASNNSLASRASSRRQW